MLKKKLGIEAIEIEWDVRTDYIWVYFKIPSTLIIPKGCKRIGDAAFRCCWKLKKVVIPESVEVICEWAFYHCVDLKEVIISKTVKKIDRHCFENCRSLDEVVVPSNVKEIEWHAFSGCGKIIVPPSNNNSLEHLIKSITFWGCKDVEYAEEETRN